MSTEFRLDAATALTSPVRTSQGFLRVDGLVARPGIYSYPDPKAPGGVRRELRPRSVTFDAGILMGYEGAPVTIGHVSRVTADNVRKHEVGTVLGARKDGDAVAATMVIKDAAAIKQVEGGRHQLSPGYAVEYDATPGTDPEFGHYDGVQRALKINHLAIVDSARGGEQMRLRLDGEDMRWDAELTAATESDLGSSEFAMPDTRKLPIPDAEHVRAAMSRFGQTDFADASEKKSAYARIVARAKKLDVDPQGFVDAWTSRLDGETRSANMGDEKRQDEDPGYLKKQLQTANETIVSLETKVADLTKQLDVSPHKAKMERLDALEAQVAASDKTFSASVAARAKLILEAQSVLGPSFAADIGDRPLRELVIQKLRPDDQTKSMSDAEITGRYDGLMTDVARGRASLAAAGATLARHDEARRETKSMEIERRNKEWAEQWRKPMPSSALAKKGS